MQKQVEKKKYYVVRERAVPEVLLKVVEAKRLLESKRCKEMFPENNLPYFSGSDGAQVASG